jgi:2-aminoethylphosphonate transport system substrate-binding protein
MRRILSAAAVTATLALTMTACGGTGGGDSTDKAAGSSDAPAGSGGTGGGAGGSVNLYAVDGLADWWTPRLADFTKKTGIKVNVIESGSGEIVTRLEKEKGNVQADVAVTLPPFIQRAAGADLLQPYKPAGSDLVPDGFKDPGGLYTPVVNNYLSFIYNPDQTKNAPVSFKDLLDGKFKQKLQYSTPGQAGDGTAVLLQLQKVLGKDAALAYLKDLEKNNVGPSASTGKLQPKVSKGELTVANGDVQMNLASIHKDKSNFKVFFPADDAGKKSTLALPYAMGLAKGAPHAEAGKKLMDYLLTVEAQTTLPDEALGLPVRTDVTPTGPNYEEIKSVMAGVETWNPDWTTVLKDFDADIAAYNKAVGR